MITITPEAAAKIKHFVEQENNISTHLDVVFQPSTHVTPPVIGLRVSVVGGGCSGFSYKFDFVETPEPGDCVFEEYGSKVFVDPISLQYLDGSVITHIKNLMNEQFVIMNPKAKGSCGCGSSFNT